MSQRELNRTTLGRQWLLARHKASATEAVAHLVGLQAQLARPPFVGLWTRLTHFSRDELADAIERKAIVKASLMRSTLHLLTRDDFLAYRGTFQPVMSRALEAIVKERGAEIDVHHLVQAARDFMHSEPRSFAEITQLLTGTEPNTDPGAMRYAVRTHLPMVQVPTSTTWCYPGNPKFALADDWLNARVSTTSDDRRAELVKRYLAAFGPATVKDMETWSYVPDLASVFEHLRPDLVAYRDERGRELFDLPSLEIESADAEAQVRFLPEFDNLLLAHQDRTRFVPVAARKSVYLPGLRIAATVLVDGFVAATWTAEQVKKTATLHVAPIDPLSAAIKHAIERDGVQLLRFLEPDAENHIVLIG